MHLRCFAFAFNVRLMIAYGNHTTRCRQLHNKSNYSCARPRHRSCSLYHLIGCLCNNFEERTLLGIWRDEQYRLIIRHVTLCQNGLSNTYMNIFVRPPWIVNEHIGIDHLKDHVSMRLAKSLRIIDLPSALLTTVDDFSASLSTFARIQHANRRCHMPRTF